MKLTASATGVMLVFAAVAAYMSFSDAAPQSNAAYAQDLTRKSTRKGTMLSSSGYDLTRISREKVTELAKALTPEERKILLAKGTEAAFCGGLLDNKEEGTYVCRLCGLPLFSSKTKFTSGTGWPSFYQPFDKDHIHYEKDTSLGMTRVEIQCERCRAHLGHVFNDGPAPTGMRYCLNSASLKFYKEGESFPAQEERVETETAYFAGGCFWGVEDAFQKTPGVIDAVSGYQGGQLHKPSYKEVCSGRTGHAETVRVTYDPRAISYEDLLERFFEIHDPTQLNRQGPDVGTQYRSAIFAADEEQLAKAKAFVEQKKDSPKYKASRRKVVTQVEMAKDFYEAEEYHQDYHARNGGACHM